MTWRSIPHVLACMALAVPAAAQMTEGKFREVLVANARSRDDAFTKLGLAPAGRVAKVGRTVRRFQFSVWIPNAIPLVELERRAGSATSMRLLWPGARVAERKAPDWLWPRLAALDVQVFATATFDAERFARPVTWASCHGDGVDMVWIEGGRVRSAGGNQCANSVEPFSDAMRVVAAYTEALVSAEPTCRGKVSFDSRDALATCYRPAGWRE